MISQQLEQGSPAWHLFRKSHLGASEMAAILGESPYTTPLQLWEEKVYGKENISNPAMERGKALESEALAAYEKEFGGVYFPDVIEHSEIKYLAASFDGITMERDSAVELKACSKTTHELISKGNPPKHYYIQCQHLMFIANLKSMHLANYHPETEKKLVVCTIERDEKLIAKMLIEAEKFWSLVKTKVPPPPEDRDYQMRDDEEWTKLIAEYAKWDQQDKEAKKQKEKYKEALVSISNGRSCKGSGFSLAKSVRLGSIDYKAILSDHGLDVELDSYRSKNSEVWTIRKS